MSEGDTRWEDSPLVTAAKAGRLLVLDGTHRVAADTLASLAPLLQDRTLDLPDGSRLSPPWRDGGGGAADAGSEDSSASVLVPVHPAFRVLALAEPHAAGTGGAGGGAGSGGRAWLTEELSTLFSFHTASAAGGAEVRGVEPTSECNHSVGAGVRV